MADDGKVVRDEEVGELELLLELLEQVDHLRLDRDVERRDRLVGDDEVWVDRERARQTDPLALTPGKLVWVAICRVGGQADRLQEIAHAGRGLAPSRQPVRPQRLANDPADTVAGVERGEGVLEDHLHPPAQRPQLPLAKVGDVAAVEDNPPSRRLVEADDRPADGGLAAAGLADEAQSLAAADRHRDAVDRPDVADVAVEDEAALDREVLLDVLQLDERAGSVRTCLRRAHAVAATRVRSHSPAGTGLKQASLCPGSISTSGGTSWRERSTS